MSAKPTLGSLAAKVADGTKRPALVRFINDAALSPRSPEAKAMQKTVQCSTMLKDLFDVGNDDICIACKLFRLLTVDVSAVAPESCDLVNQIAAPALVVLDADGKVVQILGPGQIKKGDLLAAMAKAVQPKVNLLQVIAEERNIIKDLLKLDTLKSSLEGKRKQLETAKGGQDTKLDAEVKRLEEDLEKGEALIQDREAKLFGNA